MPYVKPAHKSYAEARTLKGPPEVRPWHALNPRRDGSPVVLRRKFDYVKTRHNDLAKAERRLEQALAVPEHQRHPECVENLRLAVANWRRWLMFSIQTLEQHCKFALARLDGTLDREHPNFDKNGRQVKYGRTRPKKQGSKQESARKQKVRKLVDYFLAELPTYVACCAVAAGNSQQDEAMALLMRVARPVVEKCKRDSGREPEEAEQLAWQYLFEKTARKFNPASDDSNGAAFNTYFTWGARRATQKRTYADAAPGEVKLPAKDGEKSRFVKRGTLHTQDEEGDSAMFHPGTYDDDPVTRTAVASALSKLTEEERSFAVMRFVERAPLRQIAEEGGMTTYQAKRMEKQVGNRLRELLCDFAVER